MFVILVMGCVSGLSPLQTGQGAGVQEESEAGAGGRRFPGDQMQVWPGGGGVSGCPQDCDSLSLQCLQV